MDVAHEMLGAFGQAELRPDAGDLGAQVLHGIKLLGHELQIFLAILVHRLPHSFLSISRSTLRNKSRQMVRETSSAMGKAHHTALTLPVRLSR